MPNVYHPNKQSSSSSSQHPSDEASSSSSSSSLGGAVGRTTRVEEASVPVRSSTLLRDKEKKIYETYLNLLSVYTDTSTTANTTTTTTTTSDLHLPFLYTSRLYHTNPPPPPLLSLSDLQKSLLEEILFREATTTTTRTTTSSGGSRMNGGYYTNTNSAGTTSTNNTADPYNVTGYGGTTTTVADSYYNRTAGNNNNRPSNHHHHHHHHHDWYQSAYGGGSNNSALSSFSFGDAAAAAAVVVGGAGNETNLLCPGDVAAGGDVNSAYTDAVAAGYTLQQPSAYSALYGGSSAAAAAAAAAAATRVDYSKLVDTLCGGDYRHPTSVSQVAAALAYPFTTSASQQPRSSADSFYSHYLHNHRTTPTTTTTTATKYDPYHPTSSTHSSPPCSPPDKPLMYKSNTTTATTTTTTTTTTPNVPSSNSLGSSLSDVDVDVDDDDPPEEEEEEENHHPNQFSLHVPGVSLKSMSSNEVIQRIHMKTDEVVTRYLPCVDFLVACQQELRAGLADSNKKSRKVHPKQFFNRYLVPLPKRFLRQNEPIMPSNELQDAYEGIQALVQDARKEISTSNELVKNAFLGGMRDGESWGLRKWLSQHGGALKICNDLELILGAIKTHNNNNNNSTEDKKSIIALTERIRPKAKQALDRLLNDVPPAYQQVSTAHPYLPFFHRLESALRSMSSFDPEDDGIICLDDTDDEDDDEVNIVEEVTSGSTTNKTNNNNNNNKRSANSLTTTTTNNNNNNKRQRPSHTVPPPHKKQPTHHHQQQLQQQQQHYHQESDSDIEVVFVKPGSKGEKITTTNTNTTTTPLHLKAEEEIPNPNPSTTTTTNYNNNNNNHPKNQWRCPQCTFLNSSGDQHCVMCSDDSADGEQAAAEAEAAAAAAGKEVNFQSKIIKKRQFSALELANIIANLTQELESGVVTRPPTLQVSERASIDFWSTTGQLVYVLKILRLILFEPSCYRHVNSVDETKDYQANLKKYHSVVRTSLCFQDIIESLLVDDSSLMRGKLEPVYLCTWNMFNARDLVQAIDLVFLNALCYEGKRQTSARIEIKRLRKFLWDNIALRGGACKITKRSETSGFVMRKKGFVTK